jgi:hypothetical protein
MTIGQCEMTSKWVVMLHSSFGQIKKQPDGHIDFRQMNEQPDSHMDRQTAINGSNPNEQCEQTVLTVLDHFMTKQFDNISDSLLSQSPWTC